MKVRLLDIDLPPCYGLPNHDTVNGVQDSDMPTSEVEGLDVSMEVVPGVEALLRRGAPDLSAPSVAEVLDGLPLEEAVRRYRPPTDRGPLASSSSGVRSPW
ncbi:hypothetical protein Acsp07_46280 [Actinomycetospora sp. NBRC 106378]|nr:hypothetical protein Acsp07_46280 [Actinomycetospora sp. NBRC 106378]